LFLTVSSALLWPHKNFPFAFLGAVPIVLTGSLPIRDTVSSSGGNETPWKCSAYALFAYRAAGFAEGSPRDSSSLGVQCGLALVEALS